MSTPVAAPSYCSATIDIGGVEYDCIEKWGHTGEHQGYTCPPCPGCGGMEEHFQGCALADVVTEDGQELIWTDGGTWRLGARHERGGPKHWQGTAAVPA